MYQHMITNELEKRHIHTQIELEDKSKWGSSKENKYIQNHLLRSPNFVERLKQMVIKDRVLYEIGNIPNLLLEAFDYPDNKNFNPNNNIKLMPSNSKDKAQEPI